MAKRKPNEDETIKELEIESSEVAQSAETSQPAVEETSEQKDSHEPAVVELQTPVESSSPAPAASKEEIAAAMQEKLSRKTDKEGSDPFVPSVQLENEVKEIATTKGFPLSRGTEIGARLMARSKRTQ